MKNNINILVVDDEKTIVDVIEVYLKKEGYTVFTASNGTEALKIFNDKKINLIILDLMLPDISGEEICKKIKNQIDIPIIMLTAKVNEDDVLNGFKQGADDYVIKPFSVKQLIARVTAILRRYKVNKNEIMSFNNRDLIIDKDKCEVKKNGDIVKLTPSEYKLLLIFSENSKKLFTRNELLDKAIGEEIDAIDRIIDSHIKNLRSKIEDNSKEPKYILTVYGMGYKFDGKKDD
ncbi:response regulator transcription factor [Clostridium saudiense]|uniref:Stage 0 sporulation protein A homolog n=1 Tax=Clostridium saudiense TaxID=1414720 RepID=A0ABS2FCP5_9CLOT|nr:MULTISPECIES: response regulator transcription factor [Clostridium]MBM6818049.1 response regulator transcription factor [Clostridium saudiense]